MLVDTPVISDPVAPRRRGRPSKAGQQLKTMDKQRDIVKEADEAFTGVLHSFLDLSKRLVQGTLVAADVTEAVAKDQSTQNASSNIINGADITYGRYRAFEQAEFEKERLAFVVASKKGEFAKAYAFMQRCWEHNVP